MVHPTSNMVTSSRCPQRMAEMEFRSKPEDSGPASLRFPAQSVEVQQMKDTQM